MADQTSLYAQAFTAALAAVQSSDAIKNYAKVNEVAKRGLDIDEQAQAHTKETYWGGEAAHLNEFTTPQDWEAQSVLAVRYEGRLWPPMASMFARRRQKLQCATTRYCGAAGALLLRQLRAEEAGTRATVKLLARRIAFEEIQAVRDNDFDRRKQAVAIRQGLIEQTASLMAAAARGYASAGAGSAAGATNALQQLGNLVQKFGNPLSGMTDMGAPALRAAPAATNITPDAPLEMDAPIIPQLDFPTNFDIAAPDADMFNMDFGDYGGP